MTEPDAERAFTTYSNYLTQMVRGLRVEVQPGQALDEGLVAATSARSGFRKIQRTALSRAHEDELKRILRLSWAMEAQLTLRGEHDLDLLPDLLQGAAGEAYYAIYGALRAVLLTSTGDGGSDHTAVLRSWANAVDQRDIVPALWRSRAVGRPGSPSFEIRGMPVMPGPAGNMLATPRPEAMWDGIAVALRTTRESQLNVRRKDWYKREGKRSMPSTVANEQARRLRPTTVVDFIWRLRTGSHYRGADMFLDGVATPDLAHSYLQNLRELTSGTVTVLNTLVVAYAGVSPIRSAAEGFPRKDGAAYTAVQSRWAALEPRADDVGGLVGILSEARAHTGGDA